MNSYKISAKKAPYPSLIPYNVDGSSPKNTITHLPRLIYVEPRPPSEASLAQPRDGRCSNRKDKFYMDWEKQQVRCGGL